MWRSQVVFFLKKMYRGVGRSSHLWDGMIYRPYDDLCMSVISFGKKCVGETNLICDTSQSLSMRNDVSLGRFADTGLSAGLLTKLSAADDFAASFEVKIDARTCATDRNGGD